jgi:hypothetical protein
LRTRRKLAAIQLLGDRFGDELGVQVGVLISMTFTGATLRPSCSSSPLVAPAPMGPITRPGRAVRRDRHLFAVRRCDAADGGERWPAIQLRVDQLRIL